MIVKDQMSREVELKSRPKRIISIVPSQTELLYHLGLEEEVIGITKFCIQPAEWLRNKTRVGGTKKLKIDLIRELQPDLIIGNKEENEQGDIEALAEEFPVWMSDIYDLNDSLSMIRIIGEITGKSAESDSLISEIEEEFKDLDSWLKTNNKKPLTAAYLIWNDPAYCAGKQTFIDAMLILCGIKNYMEEIRYPELRYDGNDSPDLILLSSEPFPFKEKHVKFYEDKFPRAKVLLVDGEMFSWYGSRLVKAPSYFKSVLQQLATD